MSKREKTVMAGGAPCQRRPPMPPSKPQTAKGTNRLSQVVLLNLLRIDHPFFLRRLTAHNTFIASAELEAPIARDACQSR
jgi:hypothetical protein